MQVSTPNGTMRYRHSRHAGARCHRREKADIQPFRPRTAIPLRAGENGQARLDGVSYGGMVQVTVAMGQELIRARWASLS
ncbi:hypothetical protein AA16663_1588 [Komagataeibacter rhaeticus DSM 16663]|nr:hypothetical protein AA16663_1588 [Komagataeibacter rhaeticus DSM 16663]